MKQLYCKTDAEWREWLQRNHDRESEVWLVFYKKCTGEPTVTYEPAVEEALCFGWIDSIIRSIDDRTYMQKFTPRKDGSKWSPVNKARVARLIESGRMTEFGLAKIETAKRNGQWDKSSGHVFDDTVPEALQAALDRNARAQETFQGLATSYRRHYIGWIGAAKRPETREKRIAEAVALLEQGQKLGMK